MKVKELIEELKKCNQEAKVILRNDEFGCNWPVKHITIKNDFKSLTADYEIDHIRGSYVLIDS